MNFLRLVETMSTVWKALLNNEDLVLIKDL